MRQILSDSDRALLDKGIAEAEKQTGAQIVLASILRSDSYMEIPWKAFAMGASLAGLIMTLLNLFVLSWVSSLLIILSLLAILACGAITALLSLLIKPFARLFLSPHRMETECLQYAESLFLSHELYATRDHRGILLMVSQFERQVVILPDKGVRDQLNKEVLDGILSEMTKQLRHKKLREAMVQGLDGIQLALGSTGSGGSHDNELSDEIIEEEGA